MRAFLVALALMVALTPLQAVAARKHNAHATQGGDYTLRILAAPTSGDERAFRTVFHHDTQAVSDRMFNALHRLLGGSAPTVEYVDSIAPQNGQNAVYLSATPGANAINMTPHAVEWLLDANAQSHDGTVNQMPHEMAHLRQTQQVLADVPTREGGAQAFADYVTPAAAAQAGVSYGKGQSYRGFDGAYTQYVRNVLAQHPLEWLLATQFGKPGPITWP